MNPKTSNAFRVGLALALSLSVCTAAESFLEKLLRITGISATPSLQKSDDDDMLAGGQIWMVAIPSGSPRKLTDDSGYRSPVFASDGQSILAMKSNHLWRIAITSGAREKIHTVPGLTKIIGFDRADTNELCILIEQQGQMTVALLALTTGRTTALQYDPGDRQSRRMLTHLKGWERHYGTAKVYPDKQRKKGLGGEVAWNDVFLKRGDGDAINLSKADGVNCGQPSLSPHGGQAVFIKATSP